MIPTVYFEKGRPKVLRYRYRYLYRINNNDHSIAALAAIDRQSNLFCSVKVLSK